MCVDNLKRFDDLLEDLGEESHNFEKVMKKTQEIKNTQLEEEIYTPEGFDSSELIDIQGDGSDFSPSQEKFAFADAEDTDNQEYEAIEDAIEEDFSHNHSFQDSHSQNSYSEFHAQPVNAYQPDAIDLIVDGIFKSIDTPEYKEKRAKGLFAPKFTDDDEYDDDDDIGYVETEDLENLFGAPKELVELNQNFESLQNDLDDLDDIDSLLSEAKAFSKDEPEENEENFDNLDEENALETPFEENLEEMPLDLSQETKLEDNLDLGLSDDTFSDLSDFEMTDGEDLSLGLEDEPQDQHEDLENLEELPKDSLDTHAEEVEEAQDFELNNQEEDFATLGSLDDFPLEDTSLETLDAPQEKTEDFDPFTLDSEGLGDLNNFIGDKKDSTGGDFDFDLSLDDKLDAEELTNEPLSDIAQEITPINLDDDILDSGIAEEIPSAHEDIETLEEIPDIVALDEGEDFSPVLMSEEIADNLEVAQNQNLEEEIANIDDWEQEYENFQETEPLIANTPSEDLKSHQSYQTEDFSYQEPSHTQKEAPSQATLSDADVHKIQKNLNKLPLTLALHIRDILIKPQFNTKTKELITQELLKDFPNTFRLEALAGKDGTYQEGSKTSFMPVLKALAALVIIAFIISLGYFFIIKPYQDNKNLLQAGLEDIEKGQFDLGKDKFNRANPNLKWYNRYAEKFLEKNNYKDAEEKLVGIRDQAFNVIKLGAVDLDFENECTRLNIANLYLKQNRFEKALEDDTNPSKQYDDSLFYLHHQKPDSFDYADKVGNAYMLWANQVKNIPEKQKILKKAYDFYHQYYNEHPKVLDAFSRITQLSIDLDDEVDKKLDFITQHNLMPKLHHKTLAKLGLYFTEKERYNIVYQAISLLNHQKTTEPWAYYMMGNYYYKADNMDLAELSLIKGIHFNGEYNDKKQRIGTTDKKLESQMANMLGEVYLALANEYTGPTKFNQEKQDKFTKLSLYHFNQAKINDPDNALSYFHYGNMQYNFYNDYKKASEDFLTAYTMLKENQDLIPSQLYYHLSVSLYKTGKNNPERQKEWTEKSLEFLSELRTGSSFRIRPAVEYLLGMLYYDLGYFEESKEKFNNVLEYYQEDLSGFLRKPNPMSVRQNKIFYFLAVTHNNLGCIYQNLSIKNPSQNYEEQARLHFYKAIEMGTRYRNDNVLALSRLNLNDSLLRDNLRYAENFKIGKRPAYLYDFTPKYLEEYE